MSFRLRFERFFLAWHVPFRFSREVGPACRFGGMTVLSIDTFPRTPSFALSLLPSRSIFPFPVAALTRLLARTRSMAFPLIFRFIGMIFSSLGGKLDSIPRVFYSSPPPTPGSFAAQNNSLFPSVSSRPTGPFFGEDP